MRIVRNLIRLESTWALILFFILVGTIVKGAQTQTPFGTIGAPVLSQVNFKSFPMPQDQIYPCSVNTPGWAPICGLVGDLVALNDPAADAVLTKYKIQFTDATGKVLFPRP